jgi:uncharacterized protein (DUF305 family)
MAMTGKHYAALGILIGGVLLGLAIGYLHDDNTDGDPLYTDEDMRFLQHMSVHHQQAVDMAELVPARTGRREFIRYAGYVKRAQAAEIAQMQSLLDLAAERGLDIPPHRLHGDPPMPGVLSSAQMRALAQAAGAEFERLWLEGMIYHHQGAIDMSSVQQQRQLEQQRRPHGLDVLVEDILVEQRYEITKMRRWLWEWGLSRQMPEKDSG